MTLDSIITMVIVVGGLWGAFIVLLAKAMRSGNNESTEDQPPLISS